MKMIIDLYLVKSVLYLMNDESKSRIGHPELLTPFVLASQANGGREAAY